MANNKQNPGHIFTTYLAISAIILTPDSNHVFLMGVYGNMLNGDIGTIEFECGFGLLNDLLPLVDEQAEEVIEALAQHIAHPSDEHHTIDVSESGGLHFEEHAFALQIIHEQDEEGRPYLPEEPSYHLAGFIPLPAFLPPFMGEPLPTDGAQLVQYYNRLLALQYAFYLSFQKILQEELAQVRANLYDPLVRTLARAQYELDAASGSTSAHPRP
jgi:hypothetical protein